MFKAGLDLDHWHQIIGIVMDEDVKWSVRNATIQ
jgi:hypothetical protein